MTHFWLLAAAMVLDRLVGDPPWLWRHVPHPVVLFGKAISLFDRWLNREDWQSPSRKLAGAVTIILLLALTILFAAGLSHLFRLVGPLGLLAEMIVVAIFLAQKSLSDHVLAVAEGLSRGGLTEGRRAVSMIVGRDPATLDEAGVCRAAIESLAENFADGIVAPVLFYALAGLPGIAAYKMLNTADSMIGHKNQRYRDFGWASARLDDLANWPAARLSAFLISASAALCLGLAKGRLSLTVALRDSGLHRSPNSGWPEAAMAGALDLQLAGPRIYGGQLVSEPMLHASGHVIASSADIHRALKLYLHACSLLLITVLACSLPLWIFAG